MNRCGGAAVTNSYLVIRHSSQESSQTNTELFCDWPQTSKKILVKI